MEMTLFGMTLFGIGMPKYGRTNEIAESAELKHGK
jgi:hypothetical protein